VSQLKTTPSGKVRVPKKNSSLTGVLKIPVLPSTEKRRRIQVLIGLTKLMMVILVLLLLRGFLVITVVHSIMSLRIVVDCFVRFVGSIITLLNAKDASHGMLVLNYVQLKLKIKASFSLMSA
jgi:hypothetical protein